MAANHSRKKSSWISPVLAAILVAAVVATLPGCASKDPVRASNSGQELSNKLTPFAFFEEGTDLFLAAEVRSAQYSKPDWKLLPILVGIANNSDKEVNFSRESFVLEDQDGNLYPVVSHDEFLQVYTRSRADARLADDFVAAMVSRYQNYRQVDWRLFPFSGESSNATNSITLGRLFYTYGYLYFPMPEGGAKGKEYSLLVKSEDRPDQYVVKFAIK